MTGRPGTDDVLLGLDVGTSAVKAGLYTPDGVQLGLRRVALAVRSPHPGHSEVDAEDVWAAVVAATRALLHDVPGVAVAGVGVAAACPTPLVADPDGRLLSAVCTFADARAADDVDALRTRLPEGAFERMTGNPVAVSTCSALTARRLAAATGGPAVLGHLASFVVHRLTGCWVMDPTNAAYTGALDVSSPERWSAEGAAVLGLERLRLPELVPSAQRVGAVTDEARHVLGLPAATSVAAGCADTAASALAVGCVDDGDAFESVGTSGVLTVCRDRPLPAAHAMSRPHVIPGRWLSHAAMSSSGASVSWLREHVLAQAPGASSMAALGELAASAPPGSGGLVFLPYLAGERSPVWDPHARGVWFGMTLGTGPADLARSVFEGSAYGLRQLIELEGRVSGNPLPELVSVGGGTSSAFWTAVKADVTGRVFLRARQGDVAARGAALLAATAAGLHPGPAAAARAAVPVATTRVEPTADAQTSAVYERLYHVYEHLYPALQPYLAPLAGAARLAAGRGAGPRTTDRTHPRRDPSCVGSA
ncbi:FGGY-family carbohydrate kinase [Geodermatophilus sp. YIM 151500]|uniref:FGGY-family carbohydrate kinase n=1 Tax=Geodermatophilus sp. YIM 151500 TaxID=2984531 RepID=UPI0021E38C95|nr:FGGY-family carbohydrate kinase [Geodermatophilus sp. YIM 151500]MCV2488192.1 FGGY-family carbohydrate kinase [Geodermatophilus sp. YIM 151500]